MPISCVQPLVENCTRSRLDAISFSRMMAITRSISGMPVSGAGTGCEGGLDVAGVISVTGVFVGSEGASLVVGIAGAPVGSETGSVAGSSIVGLTFVGAGAKTDVGRSVRVARAVSASLTSICPQADRKTAVIQRAIAQNPFNLGAGFILFNLVLVDGRQFIFTSRLMDPKT